jgi:hypothetical protein
MKTDMVVKNTLACPFDKKKSDNLIHQREDKFAVYRKTPRIWWSDQLQVWLCTDPVVIEKILNDQDFKVLNFSQAPVAEHFKINLDYIAKMLACLSITLDGQDHITIRKRLAKLIAQSFNLAIDNFQQTFAKSLVKLSSDKDFDLVGEAIKPSIHAFFSVLTGIDAVHLSHCDILPQIFDQTLSIHKRIKINSLIGYLVNTFPSKMTADEKYTRIALVVIATDALLGTLSQSLYISLKANEGMIFSNILWDDHPPATGVPLIVRVATTEKIISGKKILSGQRVKMYLDAAGYAQEQPVYSKLFFGAGPHVCLGLSLSNKVWQAMTSCFAKYPQHFKIIDALHCDNDNFFNGYNSLKVDIF